MIHWLQGLCLILLLSATPVVASETNGTILATDKFGWGDHVGWINFAPADDAGYVGLQVTDSRVSGFAWARDFGWINFGPFNGGHGVTNTPEGVLGGHAWTTHYGWIPMTGVTITNDGYFIGIAGSSALPAGRIAFSCTECSVRTDWRPASVRDPGSPPSGGGSSGGGTRIPVDDSPSPQLPVISPPTIAPIPASVPFIGGVQGDAVGGEFVPDTVPEYLFDIQLRLAKNVLVPTDVLTAITSYVRFGTLPTPVEVYYEVRDAAGGVRAVRTAAFVVQTERVETELFDDFIPAPGSYTLYMRVTYGVGTVVEFTRPFTVAAPTGLGCFVPWPLSWLVQHIPGIAWLVALFGCWVPWILLLILLIILYLIYRRFRKKKDDTRTDKT